MILKAKMSPLEQVHNIHTFQRLKERAEEICKKNGMQQPEIIIREAKRIHAEVAAYPHDFKIIVTSTLIDRLSFAEAEAVIAHEIGHRKNRHRGGIGAAAFQIAIAMNQFAAIDCIYLFSKNQNIFGTSEALALFLVTASITYFGSRRMHKREYEADLFAAKNTSKEAVISALDKISKINAQIDVQTILSFPQKLLAKIKGSIESKKLDEIASKASKLLEKSAQWLIGFYEKIYHLSFYSTHPSVSKRIKNLENAFSKQD
ncbi:MAG: M48 family metalloprotease [Candidatus Micrarchaeota archaeon]|nr:M48 family metalloprotease [Candidatus Micrarchaeota archaeon]